MDDIKDRILEDAIVTALEQDKTIRRQRKIIIIMIGVVAALTALLFKEV